MADRNGYIGRAPGDSAVTVARQTFSPTGVTTDFTFASGYTVGYLDLFLNGTKLIEGVDYNATDTSTISLVSAAINGDVLEGVAYKAFNLGDANRIGIQSSGTLIGNAETLNFVGTGNTFALNGSTIDVSISGGGAGVGGTWGNYDGNTGVTTTKKVKIQNNLEVTGVTTSTGGFVGNVTGNATGLTGTPNIIVGSVTGTTGSFSGSVSIGGTLTYEDVTNIDSVGIVTARTGVRVNAGGIIVTAGISTIGAGVSVTGPYKENITAMGALEVDCSQGNYFTKTIAGNSTFTFANVPTGCAYAFTLELTHSSGTVTWPASVKFPADTAPTLTTGKTHLFMFITDDGGTRFRGSSLVDYVN